MASHHRDRLAVDWLEMMSSAGGIRVRPTFISSARAVDPTGKPQWGRRWWPFPFEPHRRTSVLNTGGLPLVVMTSMAQIGFVRTASLSRLSS